MEYTCVIINKKINDESLPLIIESENQKMINQGYTLVTSTIKDQNKVYLIYQKWDNSYD